MFCHLIKYKNPYEILKCDYKNNNNKKPLQFSGNLRDLIIKTWKYNIRLAKIDYILDWYTSKSITASEYDFLNMGLI